jgi:hypothetical protein
MLQYAESLYAITPIIVYIFNALKITWVLAQRLYVDKSNHHRVYLFKDLVSLGALVQLSNINSSELLPHTPAK